MISIILPVYNGHDFLQRCSDSIKNQTFKEWELLIGVNGHDENSEVFKYIKSFESDTIRIFHYDFKGKPKTSNELIKECKYDIICNIDVDDKWDRVKLEKQVEFIDKYDVVGTKCFYIDEQDVIVGYPDIPDGEIESSMFINWGNPIINSSSMFHKKDAFWNDEWFDDYDMWLRLNKEGKKFYNISEKLVFHRTHKNSFFNSNYEEHSNDILRLRMKYS